MSRYSTVITVIALAALLALVCGSPSIAVAPNPDGYVNVGLAQGWYANQLAWYIGTATNDVRFAQTGNMTLAGKLYSAIADGTAQPVYIVKNFQQGPVFSASPSVGVPYTGLWQVFYVTWTTATPRPITNALPESVANPTGLPITGATVVPTTIVVDYPILIIGPLGVAGPTYKIPQMVSWNAFNKTGLLPFFNVFCPNYVTKAVSVKPVLMTEASDRDVASLVGANYARQLRNMGVPDSMQGWIMDPITQISPPSQLPVLENCPTAISWQNVNQGYSPIVKGHLLRRLTAAPSSIFTNPTVINQLIGSGALAQSGTTTLNVSVFNPL